MRQIISLISLIAAHVSCVNALVGDQCGSSQSTSGHVITGPSFASVDTATALECCNRCDRAGNICIAWSFESGTCELKNFFNTTFVKPNSNKDAAFGQLREVTKVYNPEPAKAPAGARPVLFLVSDDMRPSLNLYGLNAGHTPSLERIASRGVTFRHAYVQFSYCAPSR